VIEPGAQAALTGEQTLSPDETLDSICGGAVRLFQRKDGYRFNLDPLLLAQFAAKGLSTPGGPLIDLGTGSGILPLVLARRHGVLAEGLELQPSLAALAMRNVRLNGLEGRVRIRQGDLREVRKLFPRASFRHVVSNPPFHRAHGGRTNPTLEKALARHELACTLPEVVAAAAHLLEPLGAWWVVFPASRLGELLAQAQAADLNPRRLRFVHPRSGSPARRVLLQANRQGRGTLEILPPLILHKERTSRFTDEVQAALH
jgi:tRNA1Val (adenine37-N6)-methyltransferase